MCQSEYLPDFIRRLNTNYASHFMRKGSMRHEKTYGFKQRNRYSVVGTTVW